MNQIFMLVGYFFFGWSMFELLFFYWIEPLIATLLRAYLLVYLPSQFMSGVGSGFFAKIRQPLFMRWAAQTLGVILAAGASLYFMLAHNAQQLTPTPLSADWIIFILLFTAVLFMPVFMQWRQGLLPQAEQLPLQSQILMHGGQLISTYIIIAAVLFSLYIAVPILVVLVLLLLPKMGIELWIYRQLIYRQQNKNIHV
jgi:hypothetical protein